MNPAKRPCYFRNASIHSSYPRFEDLVSVFSCPTDRLKVNLKSLWNATPQYFRQRFITVIQGCEVNQRDRLIYHINKTLHEKRLSVDVLNYYSLKLKYSFNIALMQVLSTAQDSLKLVEYLLATNEASGEEKRLLNHLQKLSEDQLKTLSITYIEISSSEASGDSLFQLIQIFKSASQSWFLWNHLKRLGAEKILFLIEILHIHTYFREKDMLNQDFFEAISYLPQGKWKSFLECVEKISQDLELDLHATYLLPLLTLIPEKKINRTLVEVVKGIAENCKKFDLEIIIKDLKEIPENLRGDLFFAVFNIRKVKPELDLSKICRTFKFFSLVPYIYWSDAQRVLCSSIDYKFLDPRNSQEAFDRLQELLLLFNKDEERYEVWRFVIRQGDGFAAFEQVRKLIEDIGSERFVKAVSFFREHMQQHVDEYYQTLSLIKTLSLIEEKWWNKELAGLLKAGKSYSYHLCYIEYLPLEQRTISNLDIIIQLFHRITSENPGMFTKWTKLLFFRKNPNYFIQKLVQVEDFAVFKELYLNQIFVPDIYLNHIVEKLNKSDHKSLWKLYSEDRELRDTACSFVKETVDECNHELFNIFYSIFRSKFHLLGLTFESLLVQEIIFIKIHLDNSRNGKINQCLLKSEILEEDYVYFETPDYVLGSDRFRFNINFLRASSKERGFKYQDIPDQWKPRVLKELVEETSKRVEGLNQKQLDHYFEGFKYLTKLDKQPILTREDFIKDLYKSSLDKPYIKALMVERFPEDEISRSMYQLSCIIKKMLQIDSQITVHGLSLRDVELIDFCHGLSSCEIGQKDAIAQKYSMLKEAERYLEQCHSDYTLELSPYQILIKQAIQLGLEHSTSWSAFRHIDKWVFHSHISHDVTFLRNRVFRQVGMNYDFAVDIHSYLISPILKETGIRILCEAVYKGFDFDRFIKNVQNSINKKLKNNDLQFTNQLQQKLGGRTDDFFDVDYENELYLGIKKEGVLKLVVLEGFLIQT